MNTPGFGETVNEYERVKNVSCPICHPSSLSLMYYHPHFSSCYLFHFHFHSSLLPKKYTSSSSSNFRSHPTFLTHPLTFSLMAHPTVTHPLIAIILSSPVILTHPLTVTSTLTHHPIFLLLFSSHLFTLPLLRSFHPSLCFHPSL